MKKQILFMAVCVILTVSMSGCESTGNQSGTENSKTTSVSDDTQDTIKKAIQNGISSDTENLLYDGVNGIVVTGSNGSVSVSARVVYDYVIPVVVENLCPVVVKAISEQSCDIGDITVQYYLETDGKMDTNTLVDWRSYDGGETGTFIGDLDGAKQCIYDVTVDDLYEFYYVENIEAKFGSTLDDYQGEWQIDGDTSKYLVISSETVNFVSESNIGSKSFRDVYSYTFDYDDDGNLVAVNASSKIIYYLSLDSDVLAVTKYSDGTLEEYQKISDNTEVPQEKVSPEIGMTEEEVYESTWGAPNKKNTTTTAYGVHEQWVYDDGYIYFDDGVVTAIQEN